MENELKFFINLPSFFFCTALPFGAERSASATNIISSDPMTQSVTVNKENGDSEWSTKADRDDTTLVRYDTKLQAERTTLHRKREKTFFFLK